MSAARGNPLSIEAVGQIQAPLEDEINQLHKKIEDADNARSTWMEKQKRLLEQRRGVKRPKSIPWPGANNDNWPVVDAVIRRWKPGIANLVLRSNPVALFTARRPDFLEAAVDAQDFYHWLFNTHIQRTALTTYEIVDLVAQHGKAYTRQGWDYTTERQSRIARVDSLFPEGIEPAYQAFVQAIQQQNTQLPPEQQVPAPSVHDFIARVLLEEYKLDPRTEGEMVMMAAGNILQGAPYVRLVYEEVISDRPAWSAISPMDVIVPPRSEGVWDAEFVAIDQRMSQDQILRMAKDGHFNMDSALEVAERIDKKGGGWDESTDLTGKKRSLTQVLDQIEGIQRAEYTERIPTTKIREIYSKIDIDGDGLTERVVLWYHPESKTLLSGFEFPYPFRSWPLTEFNFEYLSKRPLGSRGIAEMLSSHQKLTNTMHNARLDAAQITLAPMFKVRSVGQHFSRNVKFRPGARIPVQDSKDIEPILMDMRPLSEFFREEQFTKVLAEQYVGIFDPSLTQLSGTGRERRTATEVDAVVAQSSEIQSQDAHLFQLAMADVHSQLWDLWVDFGPEEVYANVKAEAQPKTIRKGDIAGEYDIVPAGSPISTNRAIILNRAREMLQLFLQDQTGLINKRELYLNYFRVQDPQLADTIVRTEDQAAVIQQLLFALEKMREAQGDRGAEGEAF
jgi:hypothetical protein